MTTGSLPRAPIRGRWSLVLSVLVGACTFPEHKFDARELGDGVGLTSTVSGTTLGSGGGTTAGLVSDTSGVGGLGGSSLAENAAAGGSSAGSDSATSGGGAAGEATGTGGVTTASATSSAAGGTADGGTGGSLVDAGPCNNDQQCVSRQCDRGNCRPGHCGNGVMDSSEAGTDCGGPDCRGCAYGRECQLARDCASGVCGATGTCAATLRVRCSCNPVGSCETETEQVRVALQLENVGSETLPLQALTFHYYYSTEAGMGDDTATCNAVNLQGGSCNNLWLQPALTQSDDARARREIQLIFAAGEIPSMGMTGAVEFTISGNPAYDRTNDYSFQDVSTQSSEFTLCDAVIVTDADAVPIWGVPPAL